MNSKPSDEDVIYGFLDSIPKDAKTPAVDETKLAVFVRDQFARMKSQSAPTSLSEDETSAMQKYILMSQAWSKAYSKVVKAWIID